MSKGSQTRPYRTLTTLKTVFVGFVILVAGLACLYFSGLETPFWGSHKGLQAVVDHLGAALIISVGLGAVWELVGKRAFALEVLEKAHMSSDVAEAGIVGIGADYRKTPDWDELFRRSRHLDIFAAYAQSWRNHNLEGLQKILARSDGRIRVFIADPDDEQTIATLAARFSIEPDELRRRLIGTTKDFADMAQVVSGTVEVYYYPGDRMFSFYVFDDIAVITFYRHKPDRSATIPTLVCEAGGTYYAFTQDELDAIYKRSRRAWPS